MAEMRRNVLIDGRLAWDDSRYAEWVASLKRDDTCFVQTLKEGRDTTSAPRPYFWKYQHGRIIWGAGESNTGEIVVFFGGNVHEVLETGVWETQFGIKRLVPKTIEYADVESGISIDCPFYEPRVDLRSVRKWTVPSNEISIAARNGAITLTDGSCQSLVLCAEKPSPNALMF